MTKNNQTVSDAYLMGIREARAIFNDFVLDNVMLTEELIASLIQTEVELVRDFAGTEMYRGSRDFWKNQLKKFRAKADKAELSAE